MNESKQEINLNVWTWWMKVEINLNERTSERMNEWMNEWMNESMSWKKSRMRSNTIVHVLWTIALATVYFLTPVFVHQSIGTSTYDHRELRMHRFSCRSFFSYFASNFTYFLPHFGTRESRAYATAKLLSFQANFWNFGIRLVKLALFSCQF